MIPLAASSLACSAPTSLMAGGAVGSWSVLKVLGRKLSSLSACSKQSTRATQQHQQQRGFAQVAYAEKHEGRPARLRDHL